MLSNIQIIMNYGYLTGLDANSEYSKAEKAYLFGNPCTYYPQIMITIYGSTY